MSILFSYYFFTVISAERSEWGNLPPFGCIINSSLTTLLEITWGGVSTCHVKLVETSAGWDTMRYFGMTMTLITVKHGHASKGAAVPHYDRESVTYAPTRPQSPLPTAP